MEYVNRIRLALVAIMCAGVIAAHFMGSDLWLIASYVAGYQYFKLDMAKVSFLSAFTAVKAYDESFADEEVDAVDRMVSAVKGSVLDSHTFAKRMSEDFDQ